MSIQIVDNFQVNASLPLDTRMVASGSVARDAIQYKYEGLRVFDLSDGVPYAWRNGTWVSENSLSLFGFGTGDYIPKYKVMGGPSGSNVLENTIIVEKQFGSVKRIGIDTDNFTFFTTGFSAAPTPAKLAVEGIIGTRGTYPNGGFFGDGSHISNINASNITQGTLNLQRLQVTGSSGFVLTRTTTSPVWTDPIGDGSSSNNGITVNRSNNVRLTNDTSNNLRYFVFYDGSNIATSDYKSLATNNSKALTFLPSSGWIGINLSPNTTIPTSALDVNGQIKLRGGTPGDKKLLMSDANGLASWKPQAEVSVPVGTIIMWGGPANQIPTNWVLCNGLAAPNPSALYSLLTSASWNNPFGSGGKVPDLRERFVVGAGGENTTTGQAVAGTGYGVGQFGGLNSITLTKAQIPKHTHILNNGVDGAVMGGGAHSHTVTVKTITIEDGNGEKVVNDPNDTENEQNQNYIAASSGSDHSHTGNTGDGNTDGLGGQPFDNRPPYYALCYIIKIN